MKPIKLLINIKTGSYPIFIGSNLIQNTSKIIHKNIKHCEKFLLVIDKKVPKKMINKILRSLKEKKISNYFFNANEKNKNQDHVNI